MVSISCILKQMPQADAGGFIKTLNNMGFMTDYLDEFSEDFVEDSDDVSQHDFHNIDWIEGQKKDFSIKDRQL